MALLKSAHLLIWLCILSTVPQFLFGQTEQEQPLVLYPTLLSRAHIEGDIVIAAELREGRLKDPRLIEADLKSPTASWVVDLETPERPNDVRKLFLLPRLVDSIQRYLNSMDTMGFFSGPHEKIRINVKFRLHDKDPGFWSRVTFDKSDSGDEWELLIERRAIIVIMPSDQAAAIEKQADSSNH